MDVFVCQHEDSGQTGLVKGVMLRLYGTREMPDIMKKADGHRRAYNYQLKEVVHKKFVSKQSHIYISRKLCIYSGWHL